MKKKYTDIIYSTNDARELSSVRLPHPGARSCSVLIRIQNRFDCVWCIMVYAINEEQNWNIISGWIRLCSEFDGKFPKDLKNVIGMFHEIGK